MAFQNGSLGSSVMLAFLSAMVLVAGPHAAAQTEHVLFRFSAQQNGGTYPEGGVTFDAAGNLYGTTQYGGTGACLLDGEIPGCGIVYEITAQAGNEWKEKVLHSFAKNGKDGEEPYHSALVFDAAGDLFGLASAGGASIDCNGGDSGVAGCGAAFEMLPTSTGFSAPVIIHSFDGNDKGIDGQIPGGNLIFDSAGNLYGTTYQGGTNIQGYGMAFQLIPEAGGSWYERYMYSFQHNGKDGEYPVGGLVFDAAGNLYGLTSEGGKYGLGAAYELTPNANGWHEQVIYSFGNGTDPSEPVGSLIIDKNGNLYGVTTEGGVNNAGTVFELKPGTGGTWTVATLYSFEKVNNFLVGPNGPLAMDGSGNLYGTTQNGGTGACNGEGCGTVYELSESDGNWSATILYNFGADGDGINPSSGLTFGPSGTSLYGVTANGGASGYGTVYEITP